MYSNQDSVNTLTFLLAEHGVRQAVVCPGSRNAPVVHNLTECPHITCFGVTDERSAGFYALGMALETGYPTVVCVTSGSAVLNVLPAVAEAFYRRVPLVVVSADRPAAWIDQLDGQTLPQSGILEPFVSMSVSLPEGNDTQTRWHRNRLVNEALLACHSEGGCPVHINLPLSEPLYTFNRPSLPEERVIHPSVSAGKTTNLPHEWQNLLQRAKRPLLVVGQLPYNDFPFELLSEKIAILREPLSGNGTATCLEELANKALTDETLHPDLVIYTGNCLVSKAAKGFLRGISPTEVWGVGSSSCPVDPTMQVTRWLRASPLPVLHMLLNASFSPATSYIYRWHTCTEEVRKHINQSAEGWNENTVVKLFEETLAHHQPTARVHYANSTAVRLGCTFAQHHIHVNRGVNGIEGSVSTAAGMSLVTDKKVVLVTGDLSFFYDSNALWNHQLQGNLRILLLNNGGGAIFSRFKGLQHSAAKAHVVAHHNTSAQGLCESFGVTYHSISSSEDILNGAFERFLYEDSTRPVLLEVWLPPCAERST